MARLDAPPPFGHDGPVPRPRSLLLALGGILALWLVASFVALALLRRRHDPLRDEPVPALWADRLEPLRLTTHDGEQLGAWFLDGAHADAASVIELHGRGAGRASRLGAAGILAERGCAVLLVTLRAHGDSSGDGDDYGWSARNDVIAAVEWLEARRPGSRVLLHGASLGGAAAIFAAGELGPRVRGLCVECVYPDLERAARSRIEARLPGPLAWIAWQGLHVAALASWPEFRELAPLERITSLPPLPLLVLSAGDDACPTPTEAEEFRTRAGSLARHVTFDGAAHDRLLAAAPAAYRAALLEWLDACETFTR